MEKYGFVYIWRDSKRKMFYIGSHWGTEDDGYVCSSNRMRNVYKRRPQDFKRRIITRVYTNRKELLEIEEKWLQKIKVKSRYYNIKYNTSFSPSIEYSKILTTEERKEKFGFWKGKSSPLKGKKLSNEHIEKMRKANLGKKYSAEVNSKKGREPWNKGKDLKELGYDMSGCGWNKGKKLGPRTEEVKRIVGEKNKINMKRLWENPEYRKHMSEVHRKN